MAKDSGKKVGHERSFEGTATGTSADVLAQIVPGVTVRVHQILTEKNSKGEEKKRIQIFEGIVLARKHGSQAGATITVRKVSEGIGVEKIFPIHSPWISTIELVKKAKVRRAKLGYLRTYGKKLKEKSIA
jgi:large subunit ribosomal protein L19